MTIAGLSIVEISEILGIIIFAVVVIRGVATKKDIKKLDKDKKEEFDEYKANTEKRFVKGSAEFKAIDSDIKEIVQIQTDHGEQLAGISATVNAVANNVDKLVSHHIGGE